MSPVHASTRGCVLRSEYSRNMILTSWETLEDVNNYDKLENDIAALPMSGVPDAVDHVIEEDIKYGGEELHSLFVRWRRSGHYMSKSKGVLAVMVLLNTIECLLVLSELIVDVFVFYGRLTRLEDIHSAFYDGMALKYPHLEKLGYVYD